jgi:hypothetical protein
MAHHNNKDTSKHLQSNLIEKEEEEIKNNNLTKNDVRFH